MGNDPKMPPHGALIYSGMKYIKLFEAFGQSEKWPLLGVHRHYDYTGPIKGADIIENGFQFLVENNPFLRAWFEDYARSFDAELTDYDIFDDDFFWGHTDENIYNIQNYLKNDGIADILQMDLYSIIFSEILNTILSYDPNYKKDLDAEDEMSAILQGVEDLSFLIDESNIIGKIKNARKKAIDDLISKEHRDWKGLSVDKVEELKLNPDYPPYKSFMPMQSGIDTARKRYPPSFPWDNSITSDNFIS